MLRFDLAFFQLVHDVVQAAGGVSVEQVGDAFLGLLVLAEDSPDGQPCEYVTDADPDDGGEDVPVQAGGHEPVVEAHGAAACRVCRLRDKPAAGILFSRYISQLMLSERSQIMAQTLREQIRAFKEEKEARYAEFRVLLERALGAGDSAAVGHPARSAAQRRRGAVWVRLEDGRSSFARFLREDAVPGWKRGSRKMGNYRPVDFQDFDRAMAWGEAFAAVLCEGGVQVTVEHSRITGPAGAV